MLHLVAFVSAIHERETIHYTGFVPKDSAPASSAHFDCIRAIQVSSALRLKSSRRPNRTCGSSPLCASVHTVRSDTANAAAASFIDSNNDGSERFVASIVKLLIVSDDALARGAHDCSAPLCKMLTEDA
jgi:hypothetical protein